LIGLLKVIIISEELVNKIMPRILALWGVLALALALEPLPADSPLLTAEEIEAINAAGMWQADPALIQGKTLGSLHKSKPRDVEHVQEYDWGELLDYVTLPASFDSRTQWPGCVHAIQNAGDCVGSWAIAAADSLSDRICVQQRQQVIVSPQYVIDCSDADGCDGGTSVQAWTLLNLNGAPSSTCVPFVGDTATCPSRCGNGSALSYSQSGSASAYSSTQSIQAAISQGGPVEACFKMYTDFAAYKSGIYVQTSGSYVDIECVKLIGWGSQGGINYWIGAGSFGTSWGMNGFFNFKMGQSALGLETSGIAANPS
jgi:cathepsin B